MRCDVCRGGCCESFSLPSSDIRPPHADARHWLELHATREGESLSFECRCTKLTTEGRCSIYAERPFVCAIFRAGGKECLSVVRKRRTPEQYAAIREEGDPEAIH